MGLARTGHVSAPTLASLPDGAFALTVPSGYVFTPQERFAELAAIAQSRRVQIIRIVGTKLRYGSALIHNVSMSTELEEDESASN